MSTPRLLVVEHEAMCPPGWVGEWLVDAGAELDVRRPYAGDALPAGLEDHTGLVVLGICLGHQLAAVALGGRVERNPRGQQIGVLDVGWTGAAASDELFGPLARPVRAVQWNNDIVVAPPPGTVVLAQTPRGEVQAARFAPTVWGVQWHPEAGEEIVRGWADHDRDDAVERGIDLDGYVAGVAAAREELRATWVELARRFAGLTAPTSRVGA